MGTPGAADYRKEWHEQFYWLHPKTVRISPYMCERKIRKEIPRSARNKKVKNNSWPPSELIELM